MSLSSILGAAMAVSSKLSNVRQSPLFSLVTSIGSFIGGALFTMNLQTTGQQMDWASAWQNLVHGVELVGQGTGLIIGALAFLIPGALGLLNAISSTLKSQTKTVLATPAAPQVIAAVADSPVVVQPIVATPEVAKAAPSDNVISK